MLGSVGYGSVIVLCSNRLSELLHLNVKIQALS